MLTILIVEGDFLLKEQIGVSKRSTTRMSLLGGVTLIFLMISLQALAKGKFILHFDHPKKSPYSDIAYVLSKSKDFHRIIEGLNKEFKLPRDITVKFQMSEGPYYNAATRQIGMSYQFIEYISQLYVRFYPKAASKEVIKFTLQSSVFLFYHELAHALIDVYKLPIVSNEETAADNLAVILALEHTTLGYDIVMNTAELFDLFDANVKGYKESDLWDEHILDSQRFYNIICLAYGKHPKQVKTELLEVGSDEMLRFFKKKKEYCRGKYARQYSAWKKLLLPYKNT
jgi:hypothetical protein